MSKGKIKAGDFVRVTEVESPWIRGSWDGEVIRAFPEGDAYVKPISDNVSFRVRPSDEYLSRGLFITKLDQKVKIRRPRAEKKDKSRVA